MTLAISNAGRLASAGMDAGRPVQFGIIGAGRIARNAFAPALAAAGNAALSAAASRDLDRAQALCPGRAYDDYESLLNEAAVEAVYIATHNGLHCQLAIRAMERGKHVLCEKPMACNATECARMIAAARTHRRHLVEAFMYRYHPCMAQARSLLENGTIGDLKTIHASFSFLLDNPGDVRLKESWGGGAVLDVGCYCVNACRYLFGAMPTAVTAMAASHPAHHVDMALHGILDFDGGRYGIVSCGFDGGVRNQIVACGTSGTLTFPCGFDTNQKPVRLLISSAGVDQELAFEPVDLYKAEIEDFARAVRGSAPLLDAEEGLRNARVIDALLESARQKGARVAVSR